MSFYIACTNSGCEEEGIPKEAENAYRRYFEDGVITCGKCGTVITEEVDPPAGPK